MGEVVRDHQTVVLPADWSSAVARLYVGLWRNDERMPVVGGPVSAGTRAQAISFSVAQGAQRLPGG